MRLAGDASGSIAELGICLDRGDGADGGGEYGPGDTVVGHVRLLLSQQLAVRSIELLVQAVGSVSWRQVGLRGSQQVSEEEQYLSEAADLFGRRDHEQVRLSAGEHLFPFSCHLPAALPSTFCGTFGHVSYSAKVVVQPDVSELLQPGPQEASVGFMVVGRLPPEEHAAGLRCQQVSAKQQLGGGGSAIASLFVPRRVFDADDMILVSANVTNTGRRRLLNLRLQLVMLCQYRARGQRHSEQLLVAERRDTGSIGRLESRRWRNVGLRVPAVVPPSGLPYSNIMTVSYCLRLCAEAEKSGTRLQLELPVEVGVSLPPELKGNADMPSGMSTLNGSVAPSEPGSAGLSTRDSTLDMRHRQQQQHVQVEVKYERPGSRPSPLQRTGQQQQQQQQQQRQRQHAQPQHTGSVISVSCTDEQQQPHSPYGRPNELHRNPLFAGGADADGGSVGTGAALPLRPCAEENPRHDGDVDGGAEEVLY